jgi:D-alanyl-D-alanine-carboxypeptidase/D-alanyl-D-alanine-endopeptidase
MLSAPSRPFLRLLATLFLLMAAAVEASPQMQILPVRLASPEEIHDMLVERIDVQHKSDGIVVGLITRHAREIIAYGKFDKDNPRVPDANTVFEIGSITKVFTALLLADMVVKGEVKLSDPVQKYLPPSVHVPTRNGKQITLLELATHHSGLPRGPTNFSWGYPVDQLYDFLNHYTLPRDPGSKYEYSNLGVGLLGHALALHAGTDYETLLRTRITGPLQMNHTAEHLTPEMQANLITPHQYNLLRSGPLQFDSLNAAGAIRSTANDMLIFLAANLGFIDSPLRPAMKEMRSVRLPVWSGLEVALGWHIYPGPNQMFTHSGTTVGYNAFIGYEPRRKVGIVVLSNSNNDISDLGRQIIDYQIKGPVEEQRIAPNFP